MFQMFFIVKGESVVRGIKGEGYPLSTVKKITS